MNSSSLAVSPLALFGAQELVDDLFADADGEDIGTFDVQDSLEDTIVAGFLADEKGLLI